MPRRSYEVPMQLFGHYYRNEPSFLREFANYYNCVVEYIIANDSVLITFENQSIERITGSWHSMEAWFSSRGYYNPDLIIIRDIPEPRPPARRSWDVNFDVIPNYEAVSTDTLNNMYKYNYNSYIDELHKLPSYYLKPTKTRNEKDMFASRPDDKNEKIFRLCIRRGRAINNVTIDGILKGIYFDDYKTGKSCSDELNEKYFDEYDKYLNRDNIPKVPGQSIPSTLKQQITDCIMKYAKLCDPVDTNNRT